MRDLDGADPWLTPWGGDPKAQWRDAVTAARQMFAAAHRRLGVDYEDIAQDGILKMRRRYQTGEAPSRQLLRYCVRMAGLSRLQWDRPGGIREPRRPDERCDTDTVVAGDEAALEDLRRSLEAGGPTAVPLPTGEDGTPIDPPASGDLVDPAAFVDERGTWEAVAARLRKHYFETYPQKVAAWIDRVALSKACGRVAVCLALRAAHDLEFRWRYADRPLLTIWQVTREVEADRFGRYSPDAFPPQDQRADRRYAYRLAEKISDAISVLMKDLL